MDSSLCDCRALCFCSSARSVCDCAVIHTFKPLRSLPQWCDRLVEDLTLLFCSVLWALGTTRGHPRGHHRLPGAQVWLNFSRVFDPIGSLDRALLDSVLQRTKVGPLLR